MNFTFAVSLRHSWVIGPAPTPCVRPTPIAASSICQALVFLWPLCLSECHAVCLVSLSTYTTDPPVTA